MKEYYLAVYLPNFERAQGASAKQIEDYFFHIKADTLKKVLDLNLTDRKWLALKPNNFSTNDRLDWGFEYRSSSLQNTQDLTLRNSLLIESELHKLYLNIKNEFKLRLKFGYSDNYCAAWAVARYGDYAITIITKSYLLKIRDYPVQALALPTNTISELNRRGIFSISNLINNHTVKIPPPILSDINDRLALLGLS